MSIQTFTWMERYVVTNVISFTEIFTPGTLPQHTYNNRSSLDLEQNLLDSLETRGFLTSISGPSKSGKTVLCESVIGRDNLLLITGGGINLETEFWDRLSTKFNHKLTYQTARVNANGSFQPFSRPQGQYSFSGVNGAELLNAISTYGFTVVIDDFHYIERSIQISLSQQFKEAIREDAKIVVVSVSHRSDDAIRANPDLRGRVNSIDIPYWRPDELRYIPETGFQLLNVAFNSSTLDRIVHESLSSPQLMQALCLELCRNQNLRVFSPSLKRVNLTVAELDDVFEKTTQLANCSSAFDIVSSGPKTRGAARNQYTFSDGSTGDVYTSILKAISSCEPQLSFSYNDIKDKVENIIQGDPPRGVSLTQALQQMDKIVLEKLGEDRVLEWDDEKMTLDIPDPYFLYFLRWSSN